MTVKAHRLKSSTAAEPFLNGSSSVYVETMYNAWLTDPNSVHTVSIPYFNFKVYICMLSKFLNNVSKIALNGIFLEYIYIHISLDMLVVAI